MHAEIRDKWVAALRSGQYEQGRGQLRQLDGENEDGSTRYLYCCLGVLCDLAAQEGRGKWGQDGQCFRPLQGFLWDFEVTTLPDWVGDWAGLADDNPTVPLEGGERVSLAQLNDSGPVLNPDAVEATPYTFEQIADVIERHL